MSAAPGPALAALRRPALLALGAWLAGFAALAALAGDPPLHADTGRDWVLARQCVELGRCSMAGPSASFRGLTHGGLWIHLLSICQAAGLGIAGARAVTLALHAAAAALIAAAPARLCRWPGAGVACWAIYLAASAWAIEAPALWNPSALPLPLSLFWICALGVAAQGGVAAAAAAGAALALSIDAHVACAPLALLLLGVIAAAAARPALSTLAALGALAATLAVSSPGALIADAGALLGAAPLAAGLASAALAAGAALRRRVRARAPEDRARATLALGCVLFAIPLLGGALLTGHPLAPRYLAPAVPATAVLAGRGIRILLDRAGARARVAGGALASLLLLGAAASAIRQPGWRAADAERLAARFAERGTDYADLVRSLRGPHAARLLTMLAAFAPRSAPRAGEPPRSREPAPREDLLVVRASRSALPRALPPGWEGIDLGAGALAVVRRAPAYVDRSDAEVCVEPADGGAPTCARVDALSEAPDGEGDWLSRRSYPRLEALGQVFTYQRLVGLRGARWSVRLGLRAHQGGGPHALQVVSDHVRWRVARVEGWRHREGGGEDANAVILEPDAAPGALLLVGELDRDGELPLRFLPDVIETDAEEVALRGLIREALR